MENFADKFEKLRDFHHGVVGLFEETVAVSERYKAEMTCLTARQTELLLQISSLEQDNIVLREREENCENCSELRLKLSHTERNLNKFHSNWLALKELVNNESLYARLTSQIFYTEECLPSLNTDVIEPPSNIDSQFFLNIAHELETASQTGAGVCTDEPRQKKKSEEILEELFGTPQECGPHRRVNLVADTVQEAPQLDSSFLQVTNERTPRKLNTSKAQDEGSPVLKQLSNPWKQNGALKESVSKRGSPGSSMKLPDQRLLLKPIQPVSSPTKRPTTSIRISPVKRPRKSPRRVTTSPARRQSQLGRSNTIEAIITRGGVRKLKQTVLNTELFKQKRQNGGLRDGAEAPEAEAIEYAKALSLEQQYKVEPDEPEEDWLVPESPPVKNSPAFRPADPDDTFVHASLLRQLKPHKSPQQAQHEQRMEDSPLVLASYDRLSATVDVCPHPYQRDAVRSKAERMKLPGHDCAECQKYYQALGGDPTAMLNKCSRHRNKYLPADTPPGFWKPFFSPTLASTYHELGQEDDQ